MLRPNDEAREWIIFPLCYFSTDGESLPSPLASINRTAKLLPSLDMFSSQTSQIGLGK